MPEGTPARGRRRKRAWISWTGSFAMSFGSRDDLVLQHRRPNRALARDRDVEPVQLGNEERGLGALLGFHARELLVAIGVLLPEDGDVIVAGEVDAAVGRVELQLVRALRRPAAPDPPARVGVADAELERPARGHEKALVPPLHPARRRV